MKLIHVFLIVGIGIFVFWYLYGGKPDAETKPSRHIPIFQAMDSFYAKYPNWNNNDVTREKYTDSLDQFLIKRGVKDIATNLPLELKNIEKIKGDDFGEFEFSRLGGEIITNIDYTIKVIAVLDKYATDSLIEGRVYVIDGEVIRVSKPSNIWSVKSVQLPTVFIEPKNITIYNETEHYFFHQTNKN